MDWIHTRTSIFWGFVYSTASVKFTVDCSERWIKSLSSVHEWNHENGIGLLKPALTIWMNFWEIVWCDNDIFAQKACSADMDR